MAGAMVGALCRVEIGFEPFVFRGPQFGNALAAGINAGLNWQIANHMLVGGDIFYLWNQETDHTACIAGICTKVNAGSRVYGVDGRVGFPLGRRGTLMPFVKVGYGHLKLTGDVDGDDSGLRYGAGFQWRLGTNTSLILAYTHADYGNEVGNWTNDNFTVGLNFRF